MTRLGEGLVGVSDDSRVGHDESKVDKIEIDDSEVDGSKIDDEVEKKGQKTSKSKNLFKSKKSFKSKIMVGSLNFLTPGTKLAFTKLKQAFFKVPILHHFDPKYHIRIETNLLGYVINKVFSQLTSNDLGQ